MTDQGAAGSPPALVFAGGIALGAFHAGAYQALHEAGEEPDWIVGTSIGAVTAALLAGCPVPERIGVLHRFWDGLATGPAMLPSFEVPELWQKAGAWMAALHAQAFGRPGMFFPRLFGPGADDRPSLYDLSPLRSRLESLVDFDRVNDGSVRLTVTATDIVSGERVVFDTSRGDWIGVDILVAACGFMPLFPPGEVDGRLLGDGGFSANMPVDLVVRQPGAHRTCYAVDLFAPEGSAPRGVVAAVARAGDLMFGNQSRLLLAACAREQALRGIIAELGAALPEEARAAMGSMVAEGRPWPVRVVPVGYRAVPGEAGPEKGFDFSRATLERRWAAGLAAMGTALAGVHDAE